MRDMNRCGLHQPDMAVNAAAFIEPALATGCISTNNERVFPAKVRVFCDVVIKAAVTAVVPAKTMTIEPDKAVAINTVEFNPQRSALVARRQIKRATIPADVSSFLGIHGFLTMRDVSPRTIAFAERQLHHPVVWKIQRAPITVVESAFYIRNIARS